MLWTCIHNQLPFCRKPLLDRMKSRLSVSHHACLFSFSRSQIYNLENPVASLGGFSSGRHGNGAFIFFSHLFLFLAPFEMVRKIRDPKYYVRHSALFQTGVSCCRELNQLQGKMAPSRGALACST